MFNVCLSGVSDPRTLDHWSFVLSHWKPRTVYVLGGAAKLDTNAFRGAVRITTADELPGDPLVLAAPREGRYVQGKTALPEFTHPDTATYMFGSNKVHLDEELGDREPDHSVYIPTADHHEMYDFVAAAVLLYDRMMKHG